MLPISVTRMLGSDAVTLMYNIAQLDALTTTGLSDIMTEKLFLHNVNSIVMSNDRIDYSEMKVNGEGLYQFISMDASKLYSAQSYFTRTFADVQRRLATCDPIKDLYSFVPLDGILNDAELVDIYNRIIWQTTKHSIMEMMGLDYFIGLNDLDNHEVPKLMVENICNTLKSIREGTYALEMQDKSMYSDLLEYFRSGNSSGTVGIEALNALTGF